MGNTTSGAVSGRRHHNHHHPPTPPPSRPTQGPAESSHPQINGNHYVFAGSASYSSSPYPNPNLTQYHQYPGYYMPQPMPASRNYHRVSGGLHPCGAAPAPISPFVEHQMAVTIKNDVNIKKETIRIEPDEENPGKFLVAFTFDANVDGSITVMFFAKEGVDCKLLSMKEGMFKPVTISFEQGFGQNFRQPSGTGIDLSAIENTQLVKEVAADTEVYPLVVKAETHTENHNGSETSPTRNCQITLGVLEKRGEKGDYQVRVMKQILWVNGMRYELQEIYGIRNAVDSELDENDPGKECVICLSEPRDTTVIPCRHMCLCSGCAKVLRFQTNRCPICRQPVERFLQIKVNGGPDD